MGEISKYILEIVTAPVITIAENSKRRNKKKSHLFLCNHKLLYYEYNDEKV